MADDEGARKRERHVLEGSTSELPRSVAERPAIDAPELDELAEHIAKVAGLRLADRQRWLLAARVDTRRAHRAESRARYVTRVLGGDTEELAALVEALRVGETRFYRHPRQLRALRRVALPELAAQCEAENRALRAWSAGCATGEEAYTLALMLRDVFPDLAFDVWATDLSADAIARARAATYDEERTRDVPDHVFARDLEREGARVHVRDHARVGVHFDVHNLLGDPYPRGLDLVLCRNVLIYFDAPTRARVIAQLFGALREGGYVALGYADHAGDVEGAEALRTDDGVLYRRLSGPVRVVVTDDPSPATPPREVDTKAEGPARRARTTEHATTAHATTAHATTAHATTTRTTTAHATTTRATTTRTTAPRTTPPVTAPHAAAPHAGSHATARTSAPHPAATASLATTRRASHATAASAPRTEVVVPASAPRGDESEHLVARWTGELAGADGLDTARRALVPVLRARGGVLDLAELRFADDDIGRELARAAQALGEHLVIVTPAGGIERFLRRHGVIPPATLRRPA